MSAKQVIISLIFGMLGALFMVPLVADLDAAPSDVRGSGNTAVASYTNSKGTYVLWSNSRITNAKNGQDVPLTYEEATGFRSASPRNGEPLGSPNVAVDYVQNAEGTFTLFADGSIKKATDEGASAPAGGQTKILFALQTSAIAADGGGYSYWIEEGLELPQNLKNASAQPPSGTIMFDEAFENPPLVFTTTPFSSGVGNNALDFTKIMVTIGEKDKVRMTNWSQTWVLVIGS